MLFLDYLNDLYYERENNISGFLYGFKSLNEIKRKKVVVFGTGENALICTNLLKEFDIEVHAYCENYKTLAGKRFLQKEILHSYDAFKNKDFYYIITVKNKFFYEIIRQLAVYDISDYSFFLKSAFDYSGNIEFRDIILESINVMVNRRHINDKSFNDIFALQKDFASRCGVAGYLLSTTMYLNYVFEFLRHDLLKRKNELKVLEISPGGGVLSHALKMINPDIDLDWISFSNIDEGCEETYLDLVNGRFPIKNYYGIIEDPNYKIDGQYDIIIMTEVLEHFWFNPINTLKKIKDSLKKDGRLYLSTPDWGHLYLYNTYTDMVNYDKACIDRYNLVDTGDHYYQFTKEELLEIYDAVGLNVLDYFVTPSSKHQIFVLS